MTKIELAHSIRIGADDPVSELWLEPNRGMALEHVFMVLRGELGNEPGITVPWTNILAVHHNVEKPTP